MKNQSIFTILLIACLLGACWGNPSLPGSLPTAIPSATPLLLQATNTVEIVTPTLAPPTEAPTVAPPSETPAPPASLGLTLEQLYNLEYQLPTGVVDGELGPVTLLDGEYQSQKDPTQPGLAFAHLLKESIALGDLNGDSAGDAVGVIYLNNGGTGSFAHLVTVLNVAGQPKHIPDALYSLGDRSRIEKLQIANGKIFLDMFRSGINDAMCCPSEPVSLILDYAPAGLLLRHMTVKVPNGGVREVKIESPTDGSVVSGQVEIKGSFTIAPFENNITYRVFSRWGVLVQESGWMVDAPDLGAPGTFAIPLDLAALDLTGRIRIEVFEASAADGSTLMLDSIFLEAQ